MSSQFVRTELMYGKNAIAKLRQSRVAVFGIGGVGGYVVEALARTGVGFLDLIDDDIVNLSNLNRQIYALHSTLGRPKVDVAEERCKDINPDIVDELELKPDGWQGKLLSGYIFLAVDSIELRRKFVEQHMDSPYVKAVFDFRTLLESAQHYAADWEDYAMKQNLLKSMQFSHKEAAAETPVSACGVTLGVATTVRLVCALGVDNYINFVKGNGIKKLVIIDGFHFMLDAF